MLIYDLETAPSLGYFWELWKQNIGLNQIVEAGRVLCWAAKWAGSDDVTYATEWEHGSENMMHLLDTLMEEADVIVAYNGNKFDRPTMNREFLRYGFSPPAPAKSVDPYLVARKEFNFLSNRMDYLGEFLGVGKKLKTDFTLWTEVLNGNPDAQENMVDYNIQDVVLLEKIYYALLPWISNHPNLSLLNDSDVSSCTNCGSSHIQKRGFAFTGTGKYQRYQCMSCFTWLRSRYTSLDKTKAKNLLTQDKTK